LFVGLVSEGERRVSAGWVHRLSRARLRLFENPTRVSFLSYF
jgi:hypothetical protein